MTVVLEPRVQRVGRVDLASLGPEWDDLWRRSAGTNPFLTWAWIGSWLETLGSEADLEMHVARDPATNQLLAAAPLYVARQRHAGIALRELRVIGSGVAAPDHLDLVVDQNAPDSTATALWTNVVSHRRWDMVHLNGLDIDGHLVRLVAGGRFSSTHLCPFLPLDGGWESVERRFTGQLRNNLKRYGRKLERDARVEINLATDSASLDGAFDSLVELHQSIRTANGDPGVFARTDVRRFLRLATHRMQDANRARLWTLDADGQTIAAILCFATNGVTSFYTTGYDRRWAKYGPGRRIMAEAVRGAIADGSTVFDFLRGDEPYKREWGTKMRHDAVVYQPASMKGRAVVAVRAAVNSTRRAIRPKS